MGPPQPPRARRVAHRILTGFARGEVDRLGDALDASPLLGRDAALAREIVFGVIRRRRLLDHVLVPWLRQGLPDDLALLSALRIGCYELGFLRTAEHAAVHEAVSLIRGPKRGVANAVLRRVAESVERLDDERADRAARRDDRARVPNGVLRLREQFPADLVDRVSVEFSLPPFLAARWLAAYGPDGLRACAAGSVARPSTHLRATAAAGDDLARILADEGVETERVFDEDASVLRLAPGASLPFDGAAFTTGKFVVQNSTSVRAGRAVPAGAGDTVLDACAAPGTKTVQLAESVGPDGTVFAHDVDEARRPRIVENARRLGLQNIRVVSGLAEVPDAVDHVLVDAPCSNTGVLARRVEIRERIREHAIVGLAREQKKILAEASRRVRPGGTVVYATCSIEPDENAEVARSLGDGFQLVEEQSTLPDPDGLHDGGYFAILRRADSGGS